MNEHANDAVVRRNRMAYSRIAGEWERRGSAAFDFAFHERCRQEFLRCLPGDRVLDIGCGLGLDASALAGAGLRVVAADIVIEFLEITRRRASQAFVVAVDMTALCFRERSFDGIFALASLLHVPHDTVPGVLNGFARILSSGGILYLHHVEAADGRLDYRVDNLLIDNNPALCFCHRPEELGGLLSAAGFGVIAVTRDQPSNYPSECAARNHLLPYQLVALRRD